MFRKMAIFVENCGKFSFSCINLKVVQKTLKEPNFHLIIIVMILSTIVVENYDSILRLFFMEFVLPAIMIQISPITKKIFRYLKLNNYFGKQ